MQRRAQPLRHARRQVSELRAEAIAGAPRVDLVHMQQLAQGLAEQGGRVRHRTTSLRPNRRANTLSVLDSS